MRNDTLEELLQNQMACWPLASKNYRALQSVKTREVDVDGFRIRLQYNPARAVSTGAKTDAASIASRPCFLCSKNRPAEQLILNEIEGYETLVNPFPIFPRHFTVAASSHIPQECMSHEDMLKLACMHPGYAVFYNGSKSGASAPDHLHYQIGNIDFLPICRMAETGDLDNTPMKIIHCTEGYPLPPEYDAMVHRGLVNILVWAAEATDGQIHTLIFPRRKHRPDCYYAEGEKRIMVSPGAVDMAGVLILPRLEDFEKITSDDIRKIYDEV